MTHAGYTRSIAEWLMRSALCLPLAAAGADAAAQQIEISQRDCATGVRLTAKRARLSDVLTRLSESLGFKLQFEGARDPAIDVAVTRQPPELVAGLSSIDSIIITQAPDPRCPGRYRIVKVWVLPGPGNAKAGSVAAPRQAAATPAATLIPPSRVEEMSRMAKEMHDTYLKLHGVPPPTPEEEATK